MKAIIKGFCLLILCAVVLTGALYIAEGVQEYRTRNAQIACISPDMDSQEGTAL